MRNAGTSDEEASCQGYVAAIQRSSVSCSLAGDNMIGIRRRCGGIPAPSRDVETTKAKLGMGIGNSLSGMSTTTSSLRGSQGKVRARHPLLSSTPGSLGVFCMGLSSQTGVFFHLFVDSTSPMASERTKTR